MRYNSGVTPTDYTYTGQYSYTADFGLMFYNARWYDPALGRFAQADTLIGFDRYQYTFNNPINFIDPSGHIPVDCYGTNYCGSNFATVKPNSGNSNETPNLTSSSNSDFNNKYSGEEAYQLYQQMAGCLDCWWNTNSKFTVETFLGFIMMAEGSGNKDAYSVLKQIFAQRLYVGGGSGNTGPYCPAGDCFNGAFNYLAATSESARDLIQYYVRDGHDIHSYMGPGSVGLYNFQGNTEKINEAIATANSLGNYALQPTVLYGYNVGPSEYGDSTNGGAVLTITQNVRTNSPYIREFNINGLASNTIYLYFGDAFYYSINQQNYWLHQ